MIHLGTRGGRMLAATTAASALVLAGCSEPSANETTAEGTATAANEQVTLTVYTSEPEEKADEINAAFEAANPDINVEIYRAGTGDLNARIAAEKQSGDIEADILWAADAPTFEAYAAEGDLVELDGVDTSMVIDQARDPNNFYVGTRIIPTVIAYNTTEVQGDDIPSSWQDLTDSRYANQIVMPNPAVSGAAAFNASAWLLEPQLGVEWLRSIFANSPMIADSNGPTSQEIAGGGHPVGIVVDYLVRSLAADGSPIAAVYPTEGAPYITEPAGIFANSENQDAAKRYIEFLLSEEGQRIAVDQAYLPVRNDVGTPEGAPELADTPLMDFDLKAVSENQASAIEAFQSLAG
ncbi:ABC transporter substrate-binding protein [Corynebacterium sp. LK2510]|uniref:ABC transporter substrate-binding protein n=1 Tax=Corynebacterium sp. LK2510 TaxID=3110472 RepID=UPI0034CE62B9